MTEVHTHTFVGGPFDGTKWAVPDDGSRGYVEVAQTDSPPLAASLDPDAPVAVAIEKRIYRKGQIRAGETVYLYWRDEALDDEDVIARLFDSYSSGTKAAHRKGGYREAGRS